MAKGQFTLTLAPGKYDVYSYNDSAIPAYSFEIVDKQMKILDITIPFKSEIKVTYADGAALGMSYLNISTDGGTYTSYGTSSQNGVFSLYLPDGKYKIYSVTVNDTSKNIPLYTGITVTDGHLNPQPYILKLPPKVSGSIINADGTPIANGTIFLHSGGAAILSHTLL